MGNYKKAEARKVLGNKKIDKRKKQCSLFIPHPMHKINSLDIAKLTPRSSILTLDYIFHGNLQKKNNLVSFTVV